MQNFYKIISTNKTKADKLIPRKRGGMEGTYALLFSFFYENRFVIC